MCKRQIIAKKKNMIEVMSCYVPKVSQARPMDVAAFCSQGASQEQDLGGFEATWSPIAMLLPTEDSLKSRRLEKTDTIEPFVPGLNGLLSPFLMGSHLWEVGKPQ